MRIQLETTSGALLAALGVLVGITTLILAKKNLRPALATPVASPTPMPQPATALGAGALVFSDEFGGQTLDTTKWIDSYPDGVRTHSNHEQQFYATDSHALKEGKLVLTAQRRTQGGMPYTSGMIASYGKFSQKFGRFEIRAKFPKGKGLWPAFWLLPVTKSWPPEIDILEILGHDPRTIYFTNHWRSAGGQVPNVQGKLADRDFSAEFHTISLEWHPEFLAWSVDGKEYFRTQEHVPQEPMYLLANLAVGGDWPGFPDATTPFPSTMEIDYIRVYAP